MKIKEKKKDNKFSMFIKKLEKKQQGVKSLNINSNFMHEYYPLMYSIQRLVPWQLQGRGCNEHGSKRLNISKISFLRDDIYKNGACHSNRAFNAQYL